MQKLRPTKVKIDANDAYHLCELYYKEEPKPYKKHGVQLLNLRNLRNISYNKDSFTLHSLIDQIFPNYRGVFRGLYQKYLCLIYFPTPELVLRHFFVVFG